MKGHMRTGILGYLLILLVIFGAVYFAGGVGQSSKADYNIATFKEDVQEGIVESVEILPNEEVPTGEVIVKTKREKFQFYTSEQVPAYNLHNQTLQNHRHQQNKDTLLVLF